MIWVGKQKYMPTLLYLGAQGYYSIRTYAILPPKNEKLLVPLTDSRLARIGLTFYTPGKWHNRLATKVAKVLSAAGFQNVLGFKKVIVARKLGELPQNAYFLPLLARQMRCQVVDATVHSGWRNLSIQLLDKQASPLGIAKIADMKLGSLAIESETRALARLAQVAEMQSYVPRLLTSGEWHGQSFQVQDVVSHNATTNITKLTPAHIKFLAVLTGIDRCKMTLEQWPRWPEIWRWAHEAQFSSREQGEAVRETANLCAQRLLRKELLFHRVHGDFAPWNVFLGSRGLRVVDWQNSEPYGLPFYDAAYFNLCSTGLIGLQKPLPIARILHDPLTLLGVTGRLRPLLGHLEQPEDFFKLVALVCVEYISHIVEGT